MGWSCRREASETMQKWTAACVAQAGSQNVYEANGKRYFWEVSRVEHEDGAVTGTILVMCSRNMARPVGRFRIEPDGRVSRAPKFLKNAAAA
jgi:hypothetical protein